MPKSKRSRPAKTRSIPFLSEALEPRRLLSAVTTGLGFWNPNKDMVKLDYSDSGFINSSFSFGQAGDQVVAGPFAGNTLTGLADYRNGTWFISNAANGVINQTVQFGNSKLIALAGDITGNGVADLVTYNPANGVWKVCDNRDGIVSQKFTFGGAPGDIPLLGDFNGDGKDDLVIYNSGTWKVSYDGDGTTDATFHFGGNPGDVPILTDLNGDSQPDLTIYNNGTWRADFNHDGIPDTQYINGKAGFTPLAGYFDSSNSIFVKAGGVNGGNGSMAFPYPSIGQAEGAASSGQIIRVEPGTYVENAYMFGKSNVTFFGAGPAAVTIAPTNGDAFALDRCTNTYIYNLHADSAASGGRGFIVLGGDAHFRDVTTDGTNQDGLVATSYLGSAATVDAQYCHFDHAITGDGMLLQNQSTLNAANCSFDGNGTSSSLTIQDTTDGRGLGITNAAIVNATNCDFSNNHAVGAVNAGQSQATYLYCSFDNNLTNDGTYVTDQSTAVFRHDTFSGNGPPNIGAVGIEILNSFTGPGVIIRNNTFSNSLGTGVFVGNGTGHQITGNTFSNNGIGILINGYVDPSEPSGPINAAPTITGNTFIVPQGTAGTVLGIYAIGGGAGGVIGGTGALENTFENFPAGNSLVVTNYGGFNPPQKLGFPTTLVLANNYTDCPGPNPKLQNVP